ncbi:MAG: hypothetical protein MR868_03930 [Lachnospiraceae bacterium]|nr:hypothetical protein [Lachnospiraceae bacterium]
MTLGTAILLLAVAIIGIVLICKCLRNKRALRIVCIVLLSLIALALAGYIGLTLIFVDAVSHQPPIS